MAIRLIVQTLVWYGLMGALLFGAAGTLAWPGAWAFLLGMGGIGLAIGLVLAQRDPGLIRERLAFPVQKDQAPADRVVTSVLLLLILAWLPFMGLDVRFRWSVMPAWVQVLGALSLLLSLLIITLTFRANSFAAPVVKIQRERGHAVATGGPYRYVRHPMYSGSLFFFIGTALLLGSWWGLAFVPVLALLLAIRIPLEERALRAGLAGYDDYAARVRYRLIPLVW
jgi:protein-S-isoprenylcysteine O-methyltransferase Ste14